MSNKKDEEIIKHTLVFYTDGSSQPNPGYAGYGVFGYLLKEAKRPRSITWPPKNKFQFTSRGIKLKSENKDKPFEVLSVYEHIHSFYGDFFTNNQAEMSAVLKAIEIALEKFEASDIEKINIITDSRYVITGYTEYMDQWLTNGWKTSKGTDVINKDIWLKLQEKKEFLEQHGVGLELIWVKGHDEEIGNEIVDLYAVIGTSNARECYEADMLEEEFDETFFSKETNITDFKKELDNKHIIYSYANAVFGSHSSNDSNVILVSSPKAEKAVGKRDLHSAYGIILNDVPYNINSLKNIYRLHERSYNTACKINLDAINANKIINRLSNFIGFEHLINITVVDGIPKIKINNEKKLLIEPYDYKYPFLLEMHDTFAVLSDSMSIIESLKEDELLIDITHHFLDEKRKFIFDFKTKDIDILEDVSVLKGILVSRPLLMVGKDIPPYTLLKSIGDNIEKVWLYPELSACGNLATFVVIIKYHTLDGFGYIGQTNLLGKFLVRDKIEA